MCYIESKTKEAHILEALRETLLESFHVSAEDGSAEFLARLLINMYYDVCVRGEFSGLEQLLQHARERRKAEVQCLREDDGEDSDGDAAMLSDIDDAEGDGEGDGEEDEEDGEWDLGGDGEEEEGEDGAAGNGEEEEEGGDLAAGMAGLAVSRGKNASTAPDEDGWSTVVPGNPRRR